MSTDPRLEPTAWKLASFENDEWVFDPPGTWVGDREATDSSVYLRQATEVLAAIDKAATIATFTGAAVNEAGWVCGACEPGDYATCEDCQSACDDVAQFVNRLVGGTE